LIKSLISIVWTIKNNPVAIISDFTMMTWYDCIKSALQITMQTILYYNTN